jgi:hypothetical protein
MQNPNITSRGSREMRLVTRSDSSSKSNQGQGNPFAQQEMELAARTMEVLLSAYPGHPWMIDARIDGGVVMFRIPLMPENAHYVIRLPEVENVNAFDKAVKKGGGELLERYGIPRSEMNLDAYSNAKLILGPVRRGDAVPEALRSL